MSVMILCVQAFYYCHHGKRDHMPHAPELRDWLETKDEDILEILETNRVNGRILIELTEEDIKELFPVLGDRKAVQRVVDRLKPQPKACQVSVFELYQCLEYSCNKCSNLIGQLEVHNRLGLVLVLRANIHSLARHKFRHSG